jgi:pilus assembly protein TadC
MAQSTLFEFSGRLFFSRKRIKKLEGEMAAAGVDIAPEAFAGYLAMNIIVISIILTLVLMLYPPSSSFIVNLVNDLASFEFPVPIIGMVFYFVMLAFVYLSTITLLSTYLIMKSETRRNVLESSLPDFLTLVASDIKAGMTLDQAMWYSAKPEFGLLSTEVKSIIKSSFSGESLEDSLDKLAMRFDSKVFTRTVSLLKQATATGGELTEVLERTAEDVRNTSIMKKEISASLILYEIFVLFAAIVGTPFLFATSQKLVEVFEKISIQLPSGNLQTGGVFSTLVSGGAGPVITSTEFFYFTIPTLFVTSLFSSFIVSAIRTGTKNQGLKYFPFVLVGALFVYWFVNTVLLGAIFGALG